MGSDYSLALRRGYQFGFLLINIWLGAVFYAWVRQFETGTHSSISRPAGVEGWLPNRRYDEFQVLGRDPSGAGDASGSDVPADHVRFDGVPVP